MVGAVTTPKAEARFAMRAPPPSCGRCHAQVDAELSGDPVKLGAAVDALVKFLPRFVAKTLELRAEDPKKGLKGRRDSATDPASVADMSASFTGSGSDGADSRNGSSVTSGATLQRKGSKAALGSAGGLQRKSSKAAMSDGSSFGRRASKSNLNAGGGGGNSFTSSGGGTLRRSSCSSAGGDDEGLSSSFDKRRSSSALRTRAAVQPSREPAPQCPTHAVPHPRRAHPRHGHPRRGHSLSSHSRVGSEDVGKRAWIIWSVAGCGSRS